MEGATREGATSLVPATDLVQHPLRAFALGEIHARPFLQMTTPRVVLHYAFVADAAAAGRAREHLRQRCEILGVPGPEPDASQHVVAIGTVRLRWETHTEVTTYSWDCPGDAPGTPLTPAQLLGAEFVPPGPLMVATRLDLVPGDGPIENHLRDLDQGSTAVSTMRDGRAVGATDFRVRPDGLTRILLIDRGLYSYEVGALVQRLIELETYRTLALLGLPEARRLQPEIASLEAGLLDTITRMGSAPDLTQNRSLLDRLIEHASILEAGSAISAYRFGASRAYAEIVRLRIASIREGPLEGYSRWSSFLERRMAPAMRTCQAVENRQAELSDRMARAANLLRTRIDVELEQQNRQLLDAINRRGRLQLRLQQWVEGLSVAAVSYYVVGLVSYLAAGGVEAFGWTVNRYVITAIAVPPVVLGIWLFVRRVRAAHAGHEDEEEPGHHP